MSDQDFYCTYCNEKICTVMDDQLMEVHESETVPFRRRSDWVVCSCGVSFRASDIRKKLLEKGNG